MQVEISPIAARLVVFPKTVECSSLQAMNSARTQSHTFINCIISKCNTTLVGHSAAINFYWFRKYHTTPRCGGIFGITSVSLLIFVAANRHFCAVDLDCSISMVNFVLVVPKQTLNVLLVSWLRLSEVGKLDAALCDRACRDIFEHSLSLRNCSATDELCENSKFINWAIRRKVKLDEVRIERNLLRTKNEKLRCELLAVVGPTLRRAVISCGNDVQLNSEYFTENSNFRDADDESDNDIIDDSDDEAVFDPDRFYARDLDAKTDVKYAVERALVDDAILDLSMHCTKLESFTVQEHHSGSVMALLQANPKLTTVTMSSCPKVLRCIGKMCPDISSITIADQASLSDLAQFAQHVPTKLARLCLPKADVKSCFMLPVLELPTLVELRLGTVQFDWTLLTTSCLNLEVFRCTVPHHVDAKGCIAQLAPIMPNLQTLILGQHDSYLSTAVLAKILENFPRLRQFCADLHYEDKLSDLPPRAKLAPLALAPVSVPALEELFVGNLLDYHYSFDMTEALQACPALHSFGFSGSSNDSKFRQCAASGIVKLVCLKMSNTYNFTELRGLHELQLKECKNLENSALICIARNCPQLTLMHVHDAPKVTPPAVLAVLKRCPQLRSLECVYVNEKEERSAQTKKREQSATAAVMELCKLLYPRLQHLRLRFV